MNIDAKSMGHRSINERLRSGGPECRIENCCGQRFIAAGLANKKIEISGVPGNALGAYLNGASIMVNANAQDAVGDTMNEGRIVIHGNIGDAAGYAMRGGKIFVKGDAGYRAGIHMKAYQDKNPLMVIGGRAGSFLGEYQAGGTIIVLGLDTSDKTNAAGKKIVGRFPATGMHGGKMILRSDCKNIIFPEQVSTHKATAEELEEAEKIIDEYCELFGYDIDKIMDSDFTVVTPDGSNPYKQMYIAN